MSRQTPEQSPDSRVDGDDSRPEVSILLPVRDGLAHLERCIESIRRQRGVSWECIAVCDGSKDGSRIFLRELARCDERFVLLEQPRLGIVAALNAGLLRCRAPLVARMDADDIMRSDRLALQRDWLGARPDFAGVGSRVRIFPRGALSEGRRRYERWLNHLAEDEGESLERDAYVECPLAHPTWMLRREVMSALGYRQRDWPEDYDLILRALRAGHRLGCHPRRLLLWRDHPARLSRNHPDYEQTRFTECKAEHLAAGFLAGRSDYMLWGYGSTGRALRRALLRRGLAPSHIIEMHPRRLGNRIHGAPVIPPEQIGAQTVCKIVVSVAGDEPRELIRRALRAMGLEELRDFVCAA